MGYKYKINPSSYDIATHVQIEIKPHDLIYIDLIKRRLNRNIIRKNDQIKWHVHGKDLIINILNVESSVNSNLEKKINNDTQFSFTKHVAPTIELSNEDQKDIYITSLKEMMRSSLENSEAYYKLGIPVVKSILIHGVSGVGKKRLVKLVNEVLGCTMYEISIHDLLLFNEEEYDLVQFKKYNPFSLLLNKVIQQHIPATIVIHDLDALDKNNNKTTKILTILSEGIQKIVNKGSSCSVIVIGLACQLRSLPQSLQNSDIFGQHMLIPIPSRPQRKALLKYFLKDLQLKEIESETIDTIDYYATQISMKTSGYVARDLKLLVRQAKLKAMRSVHDSNHNLIDQFKQLSISTTEQKKYKVQLSDFEYALEIYRPSQQIGIPTESITRKKKSKSWDDLGGYEKIKDRIKQAVLLPLLKPDVFIRLGVKPPSGLLLYGPSGCGKTALAQALMSESMMNVISIKGPEIFSKYLGETEHKIRTLFSTAKRISPCIVFIDEMDSIATRRGFDMNDEGSNGVNERVLSTLLNEIDGVEGRQGVVVIGCTNRPDQIDDALLRPGRLDQLIYVKLPTFEDRVDIIQRLLKTISVTNNKDEAIDPIELAKQTEFCSGADLENLFREAGTVALRKDINTKYITKQHIQEVIIPICEKAEDQILDGRLDIYERFLHEHQQ